MKPLPNQSMLLPTQFSQSLQDIIPFPGLEAVHDHTPFTIGYGDIHEAFLASFLSAEAKLSGNLEW